MKKQLVIIQLMVLGLFGLSIEGYAQLPADYTFPSGPVTNINEYVDFDAGGYGNTTTDTTGIVQAVFCDGEIITLDAQEIGTGNEYPSYEWYLLDAAGNEVSPAVHSGNGATGRTFDYTPLRSGYHRFRVYGYNEMGLSGCFESTDIAVYVMPEITATYTALTDEVCESDYAALEPYNDGTTGVSMNSADLNVSTPETFNGDSFVMTYQWYVIHPDGTTRDLLVDGAGVPIATPTYNMGTAANDVDYVYDMTVGTYTYGANVAYEFEGARICGFGDINMFALTITDAPAKPVINIGGTTVGTRP